MAEQGSDQGVVNAMMMHASWKETHWLTKHLGVEWHRFKLQT
jgi:hypothetical protein